MPKHEGAHLPGGLHVRAGQVWLHTRGGPTGRGLWELPGRVLPPGERPAQHADLVIDHPARALVAPTTAHMSLRPVPADLPARPVSLARALVHPRRFHEDPHVLTGRWLGGHLGGGG